MCPQSGKECSKIDPPIAGAGANADVGATDATDATDATGVAGRVKLSLLDRLSFVLKAGTSSLLLVVSMYSTSSRLRLIYKC